MSDEIAAGDELDDFVRRRLLLHPYAGGPSLPENVDSVADLEDMMEVVADQDDGKPFPFSSFISESTFSCSGTPRAAICRG